MWPSSTWIPTTEDFKTIRASLELQPALRVLLLTDQQPEPTP